MRTPGMLSALTVSGVSAAALLLGTPVALASPPVPEVSATAKPAAPGMDCCAHMRGQTMDPAMCAAMHCCDKPGQSGHQKHGTHAGQHSSGHASASRQGCCPHHASSVGLTAHA